MAVILCYGDSNTHGAAPLASLGARHRHPKGKRWPDVMAAALGPLHEVISEGLPGRTTVHDDPVDGGCRNGHAVLPAILHTHRPIDLMIVMLGTNDLKTRFSVSAYEIARSVERLVSSARAEGVVDDILVAAPIPVRECGTLTQGFAGAEARQQGLTGFLAEVADRQGAGFVDVGQWGAVSPVDGVHWEAETHVAIGEAMARAVAERLS